MLRWWLIVCEQLLLLELLIRAQMKISSLQVINHSSWYRMRLIAAGCMIYSSTLVSSRSYLAPAGPHTTAPPARVACWENQDHTTGFPSKLEISVHLPDGVSLLLLHCYYSVITLLLRVPKPIALRLYFLFVTIIKLLTQTLEASFITADKLHFRPDVDD